jgi:hypothetical protein
VTYAFGPVDAPALVVSDTIAGPYGVGAVDADGVWWQMDQPRGWDDVVLDTPIDDVSGVDGAVIGPSRARQRSLTFKGVLVAPSRALARDAIARLRNAVATAGEPIIYSQTENGESLFVLGYASDSFSAHPPTTNAYWYAFEMVCPSPFKWEWPRQCQPMGLTVPGTVSGRTYPKTYPKAYGAGSNPAGGTIQVNNTGDAPAWPELTFTGMIDTPWVEIDGGQRITLLYSQESGSATLDMQLGSLTVAGAPRPLVMAAGSQPWQIPPGVHTIRWGHQGFYTAGATLNTCWYNTRR